MTYNGLSFDWPHVGINKKDAPERASLSKVEQCHAQKYYNVFKIKKTKISLDHRIYILAQEGSKGGKPIIIYAS